ncbi:MULTISPECIES: hypothetical protein [Vagococcus]|uniref:Uncharacterized protein n=1 Tax=Vagococcus fluvialis bH819 TaxID=1255619 RepID=A0A1X6WRH5_9ENTE|nr:MULTISPECIES: hypothetical protein [Vagococcus]SLM86256.1 hypothetical protein FM121_09215 [Vagococcus fluvialis bH819]HCM88916.1 hypothetical protein [Vagococcus sp.]
MSEKKLLKSEKIRIKNDKLRAKGKDPLKGSNSIVNTGMVGINKANIGIKDTDNSNYMDKNPNNPNLNNVHKKDNK